MDMEFLKNMRDLRKNVEDYPEGEMRIDNADFIRLVKFADQKVKTDQTNVELFDEVKRLQGEILEGSRLLNQEKAETYELTVRLGIALKLMTDEQRAKIADMIENWSVTDVIAFMQPDAEDE